MTYRLHEFEELIKKYEKRRQIVVSKRAKDIEVNLAKQGNFTVAILMDGVQIIGVGVSKRMPADNQDVLVGENIAIWRALDHYFVDKLGA